jgi:hypothetical protein
MIDGPNFRPRARGGRPALAADVERLGGNQPDGVPLGLSRCGTCGDWRGECLDPNPHHPWLVVPVACRCEGPSACPRCGEQLSERRICSNYYDQETGAVMRVSLALALAHQGVCGGREPWWSSVSPH